MKETSKYSTSALRRKFKSDVSWSSHLGCPVCVQSGRMYNVLSYSKGMPVNHKICCVAIGNFKHHILYRNAHLIPLFPTQLMYKLGFESEPKVRQLRKENENQPTSFFIYVKPSKSAAIPDGVLDLAIPAHIVVPCAHLQNASSNT